MEITGTLISPSLQVSCVPGTIQQPPAPTWLSGAVVMFTTFYGVPGEPEVLVLKPKTKCSSRHPPPESSHQLARRFPTVLKPFGLVKLPGLPCSCRAWRLFSPSFSCLPASGRRGVVGSYFLPAVWYHSLQLSSVSDPMFMSSTEGLQYIDTH
jgi:hypothetical protein